MFIEMLLKTIPRSFRAFLALVLTIIFMGVGLDSLRDLILLDTDSSWLVVKCIGGIILGFITTGFFFYYQSLDKTSKSYNDLETLNKYQQAEREKQKLKDVEITHAYPEDFTKDSSKKV